MKSTCKVNITLDELRARLDFSAVPGKEEIDEGVRKHLTKGRLVLEDLAAGEKLQARDVAVLALKSGDPWFDRERVEVNICGKLFDKDLENALVGKAVGESGAVTVQDTQVEFTVLAARRMAVPQPTDEMVEAEGVENVHTLEEFTAYYGGKLVDHALSDVYFALSDLLDENTEATIAQEDRDVLREKSRAYWVKTLKEKGVADPEGELPENWREALGAETLDEYIDKENSGKDNMLKFLMSARILLGYGEDPNYDPVEVEGLFGLFYMQLVDIVHDEYKRRNA